MMELEEARKLGVEIPNTELDMEIVAKVFPDVRVVIEGPYKDEPGPRENYWSEHHFTDTVVVCLGDMKALDLFEDEAARDLVLSADASDSGVATWKETGERVLVLWWD
jgi:hypothetical protein